MEATFVYWHCMLCGLEGFGQNSKDDHKKEYPNAVFETDENVLWVASRGHP